MSGSAKLSTCEEIANSNVCNESLWNSTASLNQCEILSQCHNDKVDKRCRNKIFSPKSKSKTLKRFNEINYKKVLTI